MNVFVILGAPGAGKGTAAAKIAESTGARHISTGAMLRDALKRGTPAGLYAKSFMDKGELVPDAALVEMVDEVFSAAGDGATLILDGFPRTVPQAEALERLACERSAAVVKAVSLEVSDAVVMKRLGGRCVCPVCGAGFHVETLPPETDGVCDACGAALIIRDDDKPETIKNRLLVYAEKTAPLIDWYEAHGKLARADGSGDVSSAVSNILAAMR